MSGSLVSGLSPALIDTALTYVGLAVALIALELMYFRIAGRFNIIDQTNSRSSHTSVTIRGGGVIFLFAVWLWCALDLLTPWSNARDGAQADGYLWFVAGMTAVSVVSLIDDIRFVSIRVRLLVQFAAMMCCFVQVGLWTADCWWVIPPALVVAVGVVNAYNFMDGINGITGGYSLAVLLPLCCLNARMGFVDEMLLGVAVVSALVFCFFNFRSRARCFAGDVGSIGMAFIVIFVLGRLMMHTGDVSYLVLLLIYGVDTVLTIVHRIMLRENLGQAHRKHAFQLMANELKMPHTLVSSLYMLMQMAVSFGFVYLCPDTPAAHWTYFALAALLFGLLYIAFMRRYYHLHERYLASQAR
ncbi:MAG: glycosyltransferase family 4 protein [Bacteroidaceae bacterium]|nr:glycosyltransferase family 4 protein [Bacteroidaceae bacterium]